MTWWQTLIVAVVPAAVTAVGLIAQSEFGSRRDDRRARAAHAAERRAEVKEAHLALAAALSELWSLLQAPVNRTFAESSAGSDLADAQGRGVDRRSLLKYERERDRAQLLCSAATGDALNRLDAAIRSLNFTLTTGTSAYGQPATVNNLLERMTEADTQRALYVSAARADIA